MCGIAGIVDYRGNHELRPALERILARLVHRGPDEEGYFIDAQAALCHRRLSIIDLASGQQPMANEDQSIWVTYNGEIYNFQQLRTSLESCGHRFTSQSDTEVIVH